MFNLIGDVLLLYDLLRRSGVWNKYAAAAVNLARQSFLVPISHYPNWTINIRANMRRGGGSRWRGVILIEIETGKNLLCR